MYCERINDYFHAVDSSGNYQNRTSKTAIVLTLVFVRTGCFGVPNLFSSLALYLNKRNRKIIRLRWRVCDCVGIGVGAVVVREVVALRL